MRILLSSHFFHPSIGGIQDVSLMLAREFVRSGHGVRVITQTAQASSEAFPFRVDRRPSPLALLKSVAWCDVFFHNNISLRTAWPLLVVRRPWVIAHHMWISRADGRLGLRDRFKRCIIGRAVNISGGSAVGRSLERPMQVIDNPYPDGIFQHDASAVRDRDLLFVGRLVSDKGADLLLEALARLKGRGWQPGLTVVGGGPEEERLHRLAQDLQVDRQVAFVGFKNTQELAALMNRHRILVMPSRRAEPFGLVAVEAIACGCRVVGSEQGGLKDAIGPGGITFPNGDVGALSAALEKLLGNNDETKADEHLVHEHLEKHRPAVVARAYLSVLERAVRESQRPSRRPDEIHG